jgi:Fur family ferric uptake transcriptional regulator
MSPCLTLIEELRQRGYRLTPQREMVVEAVAHAGRHVTAEEIFEQVQSRTRAVNIATVYRTLDLLVELGMASRADLGDGKVTYAPLDHGPHCHLVCRACGKEIEAECDLLAPLEKQFRAQYGFAADLHHFALSGLCADCQSQFQEDNDEAQ